MRQDLRRDLPPHPHNPECPCPTCWEESLSLLREDDVEVAKREAEERRTLHSVNWKQSVDSQGKRFGAGAFDQLNK